MRLLFPITLFLLALQSPQDTILTLTNAQRKTPLVTNELLAKMAQAHADNMAKQDRYGDSGNGHVMDGKGLDDRLAVSGYLYMGVGENVGCIGGLKDPHTVMVKNWMKSEGHRENIQEERFTEIGIGVAKSKSGKWFYVQVFGRPR